MNFLSNLFGGGFGLDASNKSTAEQALSSSFGGTTVNLGMGSPKWQPWALAGLAVAVAYLVFKK